MGARGPLPCKKPEDDMKRMLMLTIVMLAVATAGSALATIDWAGNVWPNSGASVVPTGVGAVPAAFGAIPLNVTQFLGTRMPDIVANLRVDQPWGSAQLSAALHRVGTGMYAATAGAAGSGIAAGVAGWARFCANPLDDGSASTTLSRVDMSVGKGTGDLQLSSVNVAVNAPITVDVAILRLP